MTRPEDWTAAHMSCSWLIPWFAEWCWTSHLTLRAKVLPWFKWHCWCVPEGLLGTGSCSVLWNLCLLMNAHIYVCAFACILYIMCVCFIYIYTCIYIYVYIHTCILYIWMHMCLCGCMCRSFYILPFNAVSLSYHIQSDKYFSIVKWASLIPDLDFQKSWSAGTWMYSLGHFKVSCLCQWMHGHVLVGCWCSRFLWRLHVMAVGGCSDTAFNSLDIII